MANKKNGAVEKLVSDLSEYIVIAELEDEGMLERVLELFQQILKGVLPLENPIARY